MVSNLNMSPVKVSKESLVPIVIGLALTRSELEGISSNLITDHDRYAVGGDLATALVFAARKTKTETTILPIRSPEGERAYLYIVDVIPCFPVATPKPAIRPDYGREFWETYLGGDKTKLPNVASMRWPRFCPGRWFPILCCQDSPISVQNLSG
jgi:hypothetical protein